MSRGGIVRSPESFFREAVIAVDGAVCFFADKQELKRGACGGPLQAHHVIPRRVLRELAAELGIPESVLLSDGRNGIIVCEQCHNGVEKTKTRKLRRRDLPRRFSAFETQFGETITSTFDRIYVRPFSHSPANGSHADTSGHP